MNKIKNSFFVLIAGVMLCAGANEIPVKRLKASKIQAFWKAPVFRCSDTPLYAALYESMSFAPYTSRVFIKITYRASKSTTASICLNFKKDGKGGSAGSSPSVKLASHADFKTQEIAFDVPPVASRALFVIGLKGKPAEFEVRSIVWESVSDRATVPQMNVEGKPSSWKKADDLKNFYIAAGGGSASVQTRVRLAYDSKNLYAGFIADEPNMANLKANIAKKGGNVWEDDCVELFLFDRSRNTGWHFLLNPRNTQYTCALRQKMAGDPYKNVPWNGEWRSFTWKNKNSWEALFIIPWSTLQYEKVPPELCMNFVRERKGNMETSQWNAFSGDIATAPKFARAVFGEKGEIIRYRKAETESFIPKRAKTYGRELLSGKPGNYISGSRFNYYQHEYPGDLRKQFTQEKQRAFFEQMAKCGSWGPCLPWVSFERNLPGGEKELRRLNRKFGMKFPYAVFSIAVHRIAKEKYHAPLYYKRQVDPTSDEYLKATLDMIAGMKQFAAVPGNKEMIAYCWGIDEPTNFLPYIYNSKDNPEMKSELAKIDAKVKAETGFGKYGSYDWGENPDAGTPFRKIAFFRYWEKRFIRFLKVTSAAVRDAVPGIPLLAVNGNTCSGVPMMDYALLSPYAEGFGCDPYPTSTQNFYGMARALYHTGFSVRMVHDLANKSRVFATAQAFIYHGGKPKPEDMREWASQALKNGAEFIGWYSENAAFRMPKGFAEMQKLIKEITSMNRLELPKEMKSAILYSPADCIALNDLVAHSAYSVYSILGEHVNANFRFVSPTGLQTKIHTLDGIRVLYVPRMSYTDKESVKIILDFVKKGGTLVVFDPEIWRYNFDGTAIPERELITGKLTLRRGISTPLKYGKTELPVSAAANINLNAGKITAYDFVPNAGKPVAFYPDGKPAAVEKMLGKGKLLVFGVQPFGNSDAALTPEGWKDFFTALCKQYGEKTGLPIWSFVLSDK